MKIKVVTDDLPFPLYFYAPHALLFSEGICALAVRRMPDAQAQWVRAAFRALRECGRSYRGLVLLEVAAADGTSVHITL